MDTLRRFIHRLGTFRPRKRIVRSNNETITRPHRLHSLIHRKPVRNSNNIIDNTTITTWLLKDAITNEDIRMTSLRDEEPKMDKQTMLKFSKVCLLQSLHQVILKDFFIRTIRTILYDDTPVLIGWYQVMGAIKKGQHDVIEVCQSIPCRIMSNSVRYS